MNFNSLLSQLQRNNSFSENVVFWQNQPAINYQKQEFPNWINAELIHNLKNQGIDSLYSHQYESIDSIHSRNNVVITTGTASGKSLCYQIPILNKVLFDGQSTALLFFPTKALTYDQVNSFSKLLGPGIDAINQKFIAVYDGDTPASQRSMIRQNARILLTNPDMLNIGILPHHTNWCHFFENLQYIVIDEIHFYRGVFGSHIANLIRRLKRILDFYGANPKFIMTSATIANPIELAKNITEEDVTAIDMDGSPKGEKNFLIYNPPLVNQDLGIREGVLYSTSKLAALTLSTDIQTLVFCQTRRFVELLVREIRGIQPGFSKYIRGYRSGYLKKDRREIEEGLKNGTIKLTVATNALELGVDIGGVDAVLLAGFPGSICSLKQRIGRSGRSLNPSISILISSMNPLDQYFSQNPEYLMERPLEKALINANNPLILLPHIRNAAFELPFKENDKFGNLEWPELEEYLEYLCTENVLSKKKDKYFWLSESYPSTDFSLRSTLSERVLIQYENKENLETIGEVDFHSSLWMVHPGAVYLQDGLSFVVKTLDLEHKIATLVDFQADYLTEPVISLDIEILSTDKNETYKNYVLRYGEVEVTTQVTNYKKIKTISKEVLSIEPLDLPSQKLQTTGLWLELNKECVDRMRSESLWLSDPNDYGKDWKAIRDHVRNRDQYCCQSCGRQEAEIPFHVHHKIPFKSFISIEKANELSNLITLCPICHRLAEMNIRMRSALSGLKYLMSNLAPLLVLSETTDLGSFADPSAKFADMNPAILIYDAIPAGIGLSNSLFEQNSSLLKKCQQLVEQCECQDGCPSCVGPVAEMGIGGKKETHFLLKLLTESES